MRIPLFDRLITRFHLYRYRHRSRRQLLQMDNHLLDDIGISRLEAEREAGKPFWKS